MIKQYFKQAWQLLKENKLYSSIYIIGTAMSITMIMLVAVFLYLKRGNIYPEEHRNRMLYVGAAEIYPKDTTKNAMAASNLSLQTIKQVFYPLQSAGAISAKMNVYGEENMAGIPNSTAQIPVTPKYVDTNYWKVFQFRFTEGKPFTEEEFSSGIHSVVIAESLSQQLFGDGSAVGKYISLNEQEYRVTGVVKAVSVILSNTYADIWIPFTTLPNHTETFAAEGILGPYSVYILARSSKDFQTIRQEIQNNINRYEASFTWTMNLLGQPDNAITHAFRKGNMPLDMNKIKRIFVLLLLVFMLVPILNLSGLNSSRMEKRMGELGVRKAFGASSTTLIQQVLVENLMLTVLGGVMGLTVSYIIIVLSKQWLVPSSIFFSMSYPSAQIGHSVGITTQMLFNMEMFVWVFIGILLVNVLSAIVPAYRFSKREIIHSLYDNDNYKY
ncbi:MAG: ABC transporter permease [Proteiniphilum sp.]|uniref:ABC transporter permease n=1 Tax=Proteiniphilum sp. TaxID=1926877 RepID=UPI002B1F30F7|nr:ABC transporter permease [Proteiniphilum sp.]MEA5128652.1 ABC transporter permease [Proteiniphilum sp.]